MIGYPGFSYHIELKYLVTLITDGLWDTVGLLDLDDAMFNHYVDLKYSVALNTDELCFFGSAGYQ